MGGHGKEATNREVEAEEICAFVEHHPTPALTHPQFQPTHTDGRGGRGGEQLGWSGECLYTEKATECWPSLTFLREVSIRRLAGVSSTCPVQTP